MIDNLLSENPSKKREWSKGLSNEVVELIKNLNNKGEAVVVDCGAGEGRHSIFALEQGVGKVVSIEKDNTQGEILKSKLGQYKNSEIKTGDVIEKLAEIEDGSVDGIIDCGMSHYFKTEEERIEFAELVKNKLKKGGLYSITHFSENEIAAKGLNHAKKEEVKALFPDILWDESIMPLHETSWESGGNKHFAYKAVLKKR